MRTTVTAKEAAKELRISVTQFRRAVDRGELPKPCLKSRPWRWSWVAIEKALAQEPETVTSFLDAQDAELGEKIRCLSN